MKASENFEELVENELSIFKIDLVCLETLL